MTFALAVSGGASLFGALFSATLLAQTLRMAVPYVCAGLGGVWSERSGVVNIALEGMLLVGGLAGVVVESATGSAWAGVGAGMIAGALLGAGHALLVVRGGVDAIVSGLAVNLAASGGTRVLLRALYDSSSNSPAVPGFHVGDWLEIDRVLGSGAALLFRTLADPMTLAAALLVAGTVWTLARTRFGLRVRACGEDPRAASSAGVDVVRVRLGAVSLGGALAGLGGVALAYDQHQFQSGMSGGRGYIALAAVVLSGWRAGRAAAACLAFAALDAAQIVVQDQTRGASGVAQMLPYVATLAALWILARRARRARTERPADRSSEGRPPAALGKAL